MLTNVLKIAIDLAIFGAESTNKNAICTDGTATRGSCRAGGIAETVAAAREGRRANICVVQWRQKPANWYQLVSRLRERLIIQHLLQLNEALEM